VGEAFLLILNAEKIHYKYLKWIRNWSRYVLLDLKNPTQLTTLKKVERSSLKWPSKFASSMASLHENGMDLTIIHHLSYSKPSWFVKNLWFM
jgi:hypothetical protein